MWSRLQCAQLLKWYMSEVEQHRWPHLYYHLSSSLVSRLSVSHGKSFSLVIWDYINAGATKDERILLYILSSVSLQARYNQAKGWCSQQFLMATYCFLKFTSVECNFEEYWTPILMCIPVPLYKVLLVLASSWLGPSRRCCVFVQVLCTYSMVYGLCSY